MKEIKLGISGHQNFENSQWVTKSVENVLDEFGRVHGFTSLAIGADQLFAKLLAGRSLPYTAVIPCEHYEDTFTNSQDVSIYTDLFLNADELVKLEHKLPSEDAFYDAGMKVVDHSDVLIAVWNGKPAKGLGGTADIVRYARDNSKDVIHINPETKTISRYE